MKKLALIFVAIVLMITLLLIINNDDMEKNQVDTSNKPIISDADIVIKLDEFMTAYNEHCGHKYSGTVLVARGDNILLNKGYGMANYEENIANEPDSVFGIGSISKSFTAVAIMQLQEKGLLNVNDPISKFIDGHPVGDDITIHHLLTHTSGLVRDGLMYWNEVEIPLIMNIKYINSKDMLFEPGEAFSYSNAGYNMLAAIIEEVSGKSYHDFIRDNIFIPLDMSNSRCGIDASYADNQSLGYKISVHDPELLSIYNLSCIIGSGNIYSTTKDMYKYDRSFYNEELLSKKSIIDIFQPHYSDSGNGYGYGWGIHTKYEHSNTSHGGRVGGGYRSFITRYPENEFTLIFLTNNDNDIAYTVVTETLQAILFGKDYVIPQEATPIELPKEIVNKYTGKYVFDEGFTITIRLVNGRLLATSNDGITYELLSIDESKFHYKNHEYTQIEFLMDGYKNVIGIKLYSSTKIFEGVK